VELVDLGESGLRVSRVGLGCNNFGGRIGFDATRAVVDAALEVGVSFFDTAAVYGNGGDSERYIGEILE
jgi:aryl-alcohol dehydrogenase-like predicted oxidoreductase